MTPEVLQTVLDICSELRQRLMVLQCWRGMTPPVK